MKKKKIVAVALLACCMFTLTGCGDKDEDDKKEESSNTQKVVCSLSQEEEGVGKVITEMRFTYDKSKKEFVSGEMYTAYDLDSEEIMEVYKDLNMCEDYLELDTYFKTCKSETEGTKISATLDINLDKLEDDSKEDEGFPFKKNMSVDDFKKGFEEQNYKCTVK